MDAKETRGVLMVAAAALLLIGAGVALRILRKPVIMPAPAPAPTEHRQSRPPDGYTTADSLRRLRDLRDDSIYSPGNRNRRKAAGRKRNAGSRPGKSSRQNTAPRNRNPLRDSIPTIY